MSDSLPRPLAFVRGLAGLVCAACASTHGTGAGVAGFDASGSGGSAATSAGGSNATGGSANGGAGARASGGTGGVQATGGSAGAIGGAGAVGSAAFPLSRSSDGRHLVDQRGKPFFIVGDAAWSAIVNLTKSEATTYFDDRAGKGFNTALVTLFEHKFGQGGKGATLSGVPTNRAGQLPFTKNASGGTYDGTWGTADFSSPDEAYFAFADSIIDLAASKGILVALTVEYLGYAGQSEGWWADMTNSVNTQSVCYGFGKYIGNRYKSRPNVVFVAGGDYTPPAGSEGETRHHKILEGIQAAGANQLWTAHWGGPCLSTDVSAFRSSLGLNAEYASGTALYSEARAGYDDASKLPVFLIETGYEAEGWTEPGTPATIRRYGWWAILSGATSGWIFGHRDIWEFSTSSWWSGFNFGHAPWQSALDSPGSRDMERLGAFIRSISWQTLVPSELSGMKRLVTSANGAQGGSDYAPAAAAADGSLLVAYVPANGGTGAQSLSVDMTAMSGAARARWFNPTSAAYTDIAASIANSGTHAFTTPGNNGTGSNDWVLVLNR